MEVRQARVLGVLKSTYDVWNIMDLVGTTHGG